MDELLSIQGQVVTSALTAWLIQRAKLTASLPWIHQGTENLCRFISVAIAFLAAAGITFNLVGSLADGGAVTITFPSVDRLVECAVRAAFGYITNQVAYHQHFKNVLPVPPAS